MGEKEVIQHIYQFKRGTAQRWMEVNPILNQGEPGFEYDTGKLKLGDGFTPWALLKYIGDNQNTSVYNAPTHYDFPEVGSTDIIYKAEQEAILYQWNSATNQYEPLTSAEVGEGGGTNNTILEIEIAKGTEHLEAIQDKLNGILPNKNDIFIIKEPIADNKYSFSAYVYDGRKWVAFDGNYNANNVYFDKDFIFTKAIGTINIPSSGSTTVAAAGKNLQEFFSSIFASEEYPTLPITSATLTSSNIGSYEVGTNIAVKYSFNTSSDAYQFGPTNNGVEWSDFIAIFNDENKEGSSGTFSNVQVTDTTNLKIVGSCKNSDGAIPLTNLGNEYPEAQIKEKTWEGLTKGTLSGYRAWFCGYKNGDTALASPTTITGAQVRALGNSANGSWKSQMKVNQMQQMFFAAPKGKGYKPIVKDHSTTAPQTVQGPIEVEVEGANGYDAITYEIWYVANAAAASGSATLDITKN